MPLPVILALKGLGAKCALIGLFDQMHGDTSARLGIALFLRRW